MVKKMKSLRTLVILLISFALISGCARKTPEKLLGDAQEAFKQMDYPNAIVKLENFLEKYPNDPRAISAQFGIADAYASMNQFPRAIKEYQIVLEKYPAKHELNMGAQFAIANCYAIMTTWDKAREIWTKVSLDTTKPLAVIKAKFNIARSYEDQKDYVNAEKAYRNVLATFPLPKSFPKQSSENGTIDANQRLAAVMEKQGKIKEAIALYLSLQNKYPGNEYAEGVSIWSNVQIGDIYLKTNQKPKAIEFFNKALALYGKITTDRTVPDKAAWAMTKIGQIYIDHLGDKEKAIATFNAIIKDFPKTRWTQWSQMAIAQLSRGTTGRAQPGQAPAPAPAPTPDKNIKK